MTKIFGHLAPDTDATGSALIWEWFLHSQGNNSAKAYVLGTPNTEALFVLKRWGFDQPDLLDGLAQGDKVVIVDTNNPGELPDNIAEATIVEIIDHHMLVGGLTTKTPIAITIKPLASTASIMAGMIAETDIDVPDNIKGLILSCILSDTLEFRSPTTTDADRELAESLAANLGLDIPEYAAQMFAAKSDVSHFSDSELLRLDSKKYQTGDTQFRVSVLETTSPGLIMARKDGLIAAMEGVAAEDHVDQVLLFVVDILQEEATLLVPNDMVKTLAEKSFSVDVEGDHVVLPGIMSRKKQIIPNLVV